MYLSPPHESHPNLTRSLVTERELVVTQRFLISSPNGPQSFHDAQFREYDESPVDHHVHSSMHQSDHSPVTIANKVRRRSSWPMSKPASKTRRSQGPRSGTPLLITRGNRSKAKERFVRDHLARNSTAAAAEQHLWKFPLSHLTCCGCCCSCLDP